MLTYLNDLHRELEEGPCFDENSDTLNEGTFNSSNEEFARRQGTFTNDVDIRQDDEIELIEIKQRVNSESTNNI